MNEHNVAQEEIQTYSLTIKLYHHHHHHHEHFKKASLFNLGRGWNVLDRVDDAGMGELPKQLCYLARHFNSNNSV